MIQFSREYDIETGKPTWGRPVFPKKEQWQFDFGIARLREFIFIELFVVSITIQFKR